MKCYIDPRCKINYASYYILGLEEVFGKKNIYFSTYPFSEQNNSSARSQRNGMSIVLKDNISKKIYIDYHDNNEIIPEMYDWCDIYAKVNVKFEDLHLDKIIAIGPSFAIDIYSWPKLSIMALKNYFKARKSLQLPIKQFFLDYVYIKIRRLSYKKYLATDDDIALVDKNYIFGISTLWFSSYVNNTNLYRKKFYEEAKKRFNFEGGFLAITTNDEKYKKEMLSYQNLINQERVSPKKYIEKTKKSVVVFNTPAVENCHGWKIAEYMAMGKVIITTPFINSFPTQELPFLLNVNSVDQLADVLKEIKQDQIDLESRGMAAKKYFNDFLAPVSVIKRIKSKL